VKSVGEREYVSNSNKTSFCSCLFGKSDTTYVLCRLKYIYEIFLLKGLCNVDSVPIMTKAYNFALHLSVPVLCNSNMEVRMTSTVSILVRISNIVAN